MTLSDEQRKQIEKEAMKEYAPFEVMECFRDQQYDIDAAKINRAIKEKRDAYIKGAESYATLCQQKDEEIARLRNLLDGVVHYANGCDSDDAWVEISWELVNQIKEALKPIIP